MTSLNTVITARFKALFKTPNMQYSTPSCIYLSQTLILEHAESE